MHWRAEAQRAQNCYQQTNDFERNVPLLLADIAAASLVHDRDARHRPSSAPAWPLAQRTKLMSLSLLGLADERSAVSPTPSIKP
jgi:hypothetical protein